MKKKEKKIDYREVLLYHTLEPDKGNFFVSLGWPGTGPNIILLADEEKALIIECSATE